MFKTNQHCECPSKGVLRSDIADLYNDVELPFVDHAPGECKCTNDLRMYERDGKHLMLCSCCCLSSDKEIDR